MIILVEPRPAASPEALKILGEKIAERTADYPIGIWIPATDKVSQDGLTILRNACGNSGQVIEPDSVFCPLSMDKVNWSPELEAELQERTKTRFGEHPTRQNYAVIAKENCLRFGPPLLQRALRARDRIVALSEQYCRKERVLVFGHGLREAKYAAENAKAMGAPMANEWDIHPALTLLLHEGEAERRVACRALCERVRLNQPFETLERLIVPV